jgi:hypothetical protein
MKNLFKYSLLTAILLLAALAPPRAAAQVTPTTVYTLTNLPSFITGGATSNLFSLTNSTGVLIAPTNNIIPLWQGSGLSSWGGLITSNAFSTQKVTLLWSFSPDGTNWLYGDTNVTPAFANTASGNSTNLSATNFTSGLCNNFQYAAPYQLISALSSTNTAVLTNWGAGHAYTATPLQ